MQIHEPIQPSPLPALDEREYAEVLELGDGGPPVESIPGSAGACLHALVAAQAARTPDAIAVIDGNCGVTYRALMERANGLALRLVEIGVRPRSRCALLADRSMDSIVGVLGILGAGAAYVPVDPQYPDERLAFVLDDACVSALVTPASLVERANEVWRQRDAAPEKIVVASGAARAEKPPVTNVAASDPAYVIYTSGSTGRPKGVVVEHRNAVNLVQGFVARHDFTGHRLLMIPPLVFDASVGDLFPVLSVGATLVLHPSPGDLGVSELDRYCREYRITAIDAPAALWRRWAEGLPAGANRRPILTSLTLLMFGGEAVSLEHVRRFAQLTGNCVVLTNHYGPTETSVCATMLATCDGSEFDGTELPIGTPLPGVRVYVLDPDSQQLLPRGAEGELCVGGLGVARGYLGAPQITAERFVQDPFSSLPGARMYRTGDLVRWNEDGQLLFVGRRDAQVKIRGVRIELGEVEACLVGHPQIRDAVVLAQDEPSGGKRLVAYFAARPDGNSPIETDALRTYVLARLPAHMVPSAWVHLAELPLTINGKVDRKALSANNATARIAREYEAPVGAVETTVARIWAEVLHLDRVSRRDNFFELGGHSLLAITVIERMREENLHAEPRALLASSSLLELAALVGGDDPEIAVPPNLISHGCAAITPAMLPLVNLSQDEIDRIVVRLPGGAANVQDIYPLAPLQEGFLFHHLLATRGDVYLAPTLFSIDRRDRLNRYLDALQVVIQRHDILRTAIVWEGVAEPVQVVLRRATLPVEEVTLDPRGGDIAAQLRARFDPRHYRLDVRQAPLWRIFIAEDVPNARWVVLELMHHLAGDHGTLQVLQQEIQAVLRGHAQNLRVPLQFRNFVARTRLGVNRADQEAFFRRLLGDFDEPTTPFGLTDARGDGSAIVEAHHELDTALARRLRGCARSLGISVASVFHFAWAVVLGRTSGRDDVVFGTVMFGRMRGGAGADSVMGMFINTLPVRVRLDVASVQDGVRATHRLLTELLGYEHTSLVLAQRCSSVQPPIPLFTSLLNYRYIGEGTAELVRDAVSLAADDGDSAPHATGMKLLEEQERSNFPFDLSINDLGEGFSLTAQVDGAIDARRICELMNQALVSMVDALERAPGTRACHLEVLAPVERRQVLVNFNDTSRATSSRECIHELFEAQVLRAPDTVAVISGSREITYLELNGRANRLARHLRGRGVRPDDRVALCADRSIEMVVGMLAVLKAGGAYVPLDPAYPRDRLTLMLEDCAPVAVLSYLEGSDRTELRELLSAHASTSIDLRADASLWMHDSDSNVSVADLGLTPRNLAYLIYTSGSTGKPKGVMVEHASVVNLTCAHIAITGLSDADRVLQFASFGFDASVEEIFPPLAVGAQVVLRPVDLFAPDDRFFHFMRDMRISVAELPTAFWHQWTQQIRREYRPEDLPRLVVVGGEKAERRHFLAWRESACGQHCRWLNTYGPTEATVYATAIALDSRDPMPNGEIPIGRPIANTQIYILDAHRMPVPIGVTGQIYIGGAGVARGYLHRAELTAQRFVSDPFSPSPHARMYCTGDLGRFLPDGSVEYLGRNDQQVKIRGFRIELGEIEARLAESPAVRAAIVMAREDAGVDRRLVAYVIPAAPAAVLDIEALRAHLGAQLPQHMVPAAYVELASFPLTPNGKLDLKALPAPDAAAYANRGIEPPVGELENTLAQVWATVLNVTRVGRHDNFFEMGGHSLLMLQVMNGLRERGVELEITQLFRHPTVESLAASMNTKPADSLRSGASCVRRGEQTPLFLVHDGFGDERYFSVLARHLPDSLPVYGLPPVPPHEQQRRTVQELAARQVEMIRLVQPHGPYQLAGWSFGGLLAYEIAQQLLDAGQSVAFLGLMDTVCPQAQERGSRRECTAEEVLADLCGRHLRAQSRDPAATGGHAHEEFTSLFQRLRALRELPPGLEHLSSREAFVHCQYSEVHSRAIDNYSPRAIGIAVNLFLASERPADFPFEPATLGWRRLIAAPLLNVIHVSGSHESLMTSPHIEVLGHRLTQAISAAAMLRARESVALPRRAVGCERFGSTSEAAHS